MRPILHTRNVHESHPTCPAGTFARHSPEGRARSVPEETDATYTELASSIGNGGGSGGDHGGARCGASDTGRRFHTTRRHAVDQGRDDALSGLHAADRA